MADVHEDFAPKRSSVREGQRTSRTAPPSSEDRGHKVVVPDVAKGQKPADGSKAAPAVPPTMPPAPPPPRPKKKD
jgi:hypothetical protein